MPSAEGRGRAKAAWDAYVNLLRPASESLFGSAIRNYSASKGTELVGFWLVWHLHGGFEGLQQLGMSRSSIFRKIAAFRNGFGAHPDEYEFPGVSLDIEAYLRGSADTPKS